MTLKSCRICGSICLKKIFENKDCPAVSHMYLKQPADDSYQPLTVVICGRCHAIQLEEDFDASKYKQDYQRNISFSQQANKHCIAAAGRLVELLPKRSNDHYRFIEIGCGNGLFMETLKMRYPAMALEGYEPSKAAADSAKCRGLDVKNEYFTKDSMTGKHDAFAIRFVLEHLGDPIKTLSSLVPALAIDAVGLIEVPNASKQLAEGRWYDYFHEHILYFTPESLMATISKSGFEVIELSLTNNEEFIRAYVRMRPPAMPSIGKPYAVSYPGKVYAWGASGSAAVWLSLTRGISCIIDSDANKHGLFLAGSGLQICRPSKIIEDPPDTIVITASTYQSEIAAQIKSMGFKGRIESFKDGEVL